jgi:hypothetical protein
MNRGKLAAALTAVLLSGAPLAAQAPAFRWQAGQVLLYRVEYRTLASDTVGGTTTETRTAGKVTRRWQVSAVDAGGSATMQMSIVALAQEQTIPGGEVLKYDSAAPDRSTPQLKESFGRLLNVALGTARVDTRGSVVQIKSSSGGVFNFDNQLPFVICLPQGGLKVGQTWERAYTITLNPPLGTGEKHELIQRFTCKALAADKATVTLTTQQKSPPKVPADALPLWQMMPAGEAVFDLKAGRLESATLTIDKELKGHQGEGSLTRFQSAYTIRYAGDR